MRQQQQHGTRKVELAKLSDDDIKAVLFFRPGARNDPSYRRISQAAIEYCKDVQAQMMDDIKGRQPTHALEPVDTDNNPAAPSISSSCLDPGFLYPSTNNNADYSVETSAESSPHDESIATINNYNDLMRQAALNSRDRAARLRIMRIRDLDLEPLFELLTVSQRRPPPFTDLQDMLLLIRKLDPGSDGVTAASVISSAWWNNTSSSAVSSEEIQQQTQQSKRIWERNMACYIHTANTLMGNFHGMLPFCWLNQAYLASIRQDLADGDIHRLPKIPTLEELDRSGYSISAFPRIQYGIKIVGKDVSVQILSLTDLRYRDVDMNMDRDNVVWKYYCDNILKLSKLIPNKRSFDVAVDVGMIPHDMLALVDFTWWTNNVIKLGREVQVDAVGRDTYKLFKGLHREYYSVWRTIKRDYAEQLKYNPVQFILNIVMAIVALASLVFATTGVLQVLQGFCVFGDEYC